MLNLKHYNESATNFLVDVIKNKRASDKDPDYKGRVQALAEALKGYFTSYDNLFAVDTLHALVAAGYTGSTADDLVGLYSYHSVIMQKLKRGVTTVDLKRIISTCQNCTIGEINSFDHTVPKTEFPEFAVHPKNLFPSCSRCNGHKSSTWRDKDKRLFLNLYLDQLPTQQYLFVNVNALSADIDITFTVKNPHGIPQALYYKIDYHYEKLQLCKRFKENADRVITPLKNSIASGLHRLTEKEAVETALETVEKNRIAFGFNYWKSILEIQLLSSDTFLKMCAASK